MRKGSHGPARANVGAPPPDQASGQGQSFFWWEDDTLVVNILGKPSASRDAIGKPKGQQKFPPTLCHPKQLI